MSGYVFELTFHTVCMSLGCDDPMLGLQGLARRAWGASPGWLIAALTRHTFTQKGTQRHKFTQVHQSHVHRHRHVSTLLFFLTRWMHVVVIHIQKFCTMNYFVPVTGIFIYLFFLQMEREFQIWKCNLHNLKQQEGCKMANSSANSILP